MSFDTSHLERRSRRCLNDSDRYKEHSAYDLDRHVILTCAVTLANRSKEEGAAPIAGDIDQQGFILSEVHVDRAHVNSPLVATVQSEGGTVFAKPWAVRAIKRGLFSKADFRIDLRAATITCPAGEVESFEPGETVLFDPEVYGACPLRANCTQAASDLRGTGDELARAGVACARYPPALVAAPALRPGPARPCVGEAGPRPALLERARDPMAATCRLQLRPQRDSAR